MSMGSSRESRSMTQTLGPETPAEEISEDEENWGRECQSRLGERRGRKKSFCFAKKKAEHGGHRVKASKALNNENEMACTRQERDVTEKFSPYFLQDFLPRPRRLYSPKSSSIRLSTMDGTNMRRFLCPTDFPSLLISPFSLFSCRPLRKTLNFCEQ